MTKKTAKKTAKKTVKKVSKTVKKAVKATVKNPVKKAVKKIVKKTTVKKDVLAKTEKEIASKPKTTAKKAKKIKCPLTKKELTDFRKMLLEKRRSLVGDMNGIESGAHSEHGDLSTLPTHPADIGSDSYEQEFSLGLLQSERQLLVDIDDSLRRIEEGTYGICEGTGLPINKARLSARPWSKFGIEYARMKEKGLLPRLEEDEE